MIATTRGALIRGEGEDEYGDPVDDNTLPPVDGFADFPLSLIEKDERTFDQASNQWRSISRLVGRVPSNVPVDEGDRIKDLRDDAIYIVDGFRRTPRGLSGRASVTMNLRRTA